MATTRTVSPHFLKPMYTSAHLNLRGFNWGRDGFRVFAKKADARAFAMARGWLASDATRVENRFWRGWVVGQRVDHQTFSVLGDMGPVHLKFSGKFLGDS